MNAISSRYTPSFITWRVAYRQLPNRLSSPYAGRLMRTYDEQVFCKSAGVHATRYDTTRVTDQIDWKTIILWSSSLESEVDEFLPRFFESARRRKEDDVIECGCRWSFSHVRAARSPSPNNANKIRGLEKTQIGIANRMKITCYREVPVGMGTDHWRPPICRR